jgi:cell division protein FtsB
MEVEERRVRIPKPVNAVLDWAERHARALAVVIVLVVAAVAVRWLPILAGFVLGLAAGGFAVQLRLSKRIARLRREVDDLLRQNGALRHRNTVLSSGIITREAQATQALVAIPELLPEPLDPQRTQALPALPEDASPDTSPSARTKALEELGDLALEEPNAAEFEPAGSEAAESRPGEDAESGEPAEPAESRAKESGRPRHASRQSRRERSRSRR